MGRLLFAPRLQQLADFTKILRTTGRAETRLALFQTVTEMSEEEVKDLLYNGLLPLESSVDTWEKALTETKTIGIESCIRETLTTLQRHYPCKDELIVELYPMSAQDQFGRGKLRGVSAWTNCDGGTLHFIVYPAADTIPSLRSTVVHEYHHYYRIRTLLGGHNDTSLLERLVSEGMAEHFVAEVLGDSARGPYSRALSHCEARILWQKVYRQRVSLRGEDNVNPYVFGKGKSNLPLWAGYAMGYYLVNWYRQSHPKVSVSSLTRLEPECFLPLG